MNNREKILLIDFSKVVSPIGISRHLSSCLSNFVELPEDEIRSMYKQHIGALVKGEYSISVFLEELVPHLKNSFLKDDLFEASKKIPTLDMDFLQGIKVLKKTHYIYLVSDIHEILGNVLRKELKQYFDGFIFSFEEKAKKSEDIFWQNLQKKVDFSKVDLFVDDKEENICLAGKYGIKGLIYDANKGVESVVSNVYLHKDYCVLGAGAAGIIFSYNLLKYTKKSFCVLEKQSHPFGLMKSFKLSNSWCDLGGHALHDTDKKVLKYFHEEGEIDSYRQKRKAYIDYKGQFIPFPFQLHLSYLGSKERNICVFDFLKSYIKYKLLFKNKNPENLESFLMISFGRSICNNFLRPYNEKLWKMALNKISCNWSKRIPLESVKKILKGSFVKDDENYGSNSYVNYPERGGFENYLSRFFLKIKKYVKFSCKIININVKYHVIYTDNQVFHYGKLVSTIPLNEILELSGINYEKKIFKYLSIQIFSVVLQKFEDFKQRIYVKDKGYFFHKCVLNSNSSLSQKNQNEFVVQFEATYKNGEPVDKNDFRENCLNYLQERGLLKNQNSIIAEDYREIRYGYPIQTLDLLDKKNYYISQLGKMQIFVLGRFGSWEYSNLGDIIHKTNALFKLLENENFIF